MNEPQSYTGLAAAAVDLAGAELSTEQLAAFSWYAARVEKSVELQSQLAKAFEAEEPALVVVPIDYRENQLLTQKLGEIQCQS